MTLGITAAGLATAGTIAGGVGALAGGAASVAGLFGRRGGGGGYPGYNVIEMPPFSEDPYVGKSQDYLWNFGTGAMEGKLPDTYMPLIQFGSQPFEDMLGMKNRDIISGITESAAKRGLGRGSNISPAIAKAVADSSTVARYGDYKDTLTNMRSILGLGTETVEGVRSGALTNQQQKNAYEIAKAGGLASQMDNVYNADQNAFTYAQGQENAGGGVSDVIGQVGNIFGLAGGNDGLLMSLAGLFGGNQNSTPRGSASGERPDSFKGLDISKLFELFKSNQ